MKLRDLQDAVRETPRFRIVGTRSRSRFLPEWPGAEVSTVGLSGVVQHDIDDQVVEVWAGTPLEELQSVLSKHNQCLPLVTDLPKDVSQCCGTVGGFVSMNLPHALSEQTGGPRDWVLGMTVVRTDGTIAKCGSKAVKNVAGYDAHRLFVGSRGTLVVIASVILRTYPVRALPAHTVEVRKDAVPQCLTRTLRSEFATVIEATSGLIAFDPSSCTLWLEGEAPLVKDGWMIGKGGAFKRPVQPKKFEDAARQIFDPHCKLAPGWSL